MNELPGRLSRKILDREALIERFGRPRSERLVFTNGCFDLLHRGHVEYLARARALGDLLVVGLNTDASVQRLKGPDRPLVSEEDRVVVVAGLEAVSAVTLFGEDTPLELIRALRPDILVKGGDYRPEEVVGRESVEADGGRVEIIPFVPGRSTSGLIDRMRATENG